MERSRDRKGRQFALREEKEVPSIETHTLENWRMKLIVVLRGADIIILFLQSVSCADVPESLDIGKTDFLIAYA